MAYVRGHQAKVVLEKDVSTRQDIRRSWMVLEMEQLEEAVRYMLLDVVEVEEEVEMSRVRRHGLENQVQVMNENVQKELEKEPGMYGLCSDLMMKVLRIVGDSSTVWFDWKMFGDGLIVSYDSRTFVDSLIVLRDSNGSGDGLDTWRDS